MPAPRLFEAVDDPRERWVHVLATLLALAGPETRSALVEELGGEARPEAEAAVVRWRTVLGEAAVDVLVRGPGGAWALAVVASLGFEELGSERTHAVAAALAQAGDRGVVVAVTPDRRPAPGVVEGAAAGTEIHHRSWLRLRDWVQERPERGAAAGADLLLLREAEYFLTPRVAELYRLENVMPGVRAELRPSLAAAFFDLNDLAPAPLITAGGPGSWRVAFPRTGDARVELTLIDGRLAIRLAIPEPGPGAAGEDGWSVLRLEGPADYTGARAWVQGAARELLPRQR
jgi:hypothetical protein